MHPHLSRRRFPQWVIMTHAHQGRQDGQFPKKSIKLNTIRNYPHPIRVRCPLRTQRRIIVTARKRRHALGMKTLRRARGGCRSYAWSPLPDEGLPCRARRRSRRWLDCPAPFGRGNHGKGGACNAPGEGTAAGRRQKDFLVTRGRAYPLSLQPLRG